MEGHGLVPLTSKAMAFGRIYRRLDRVTSDGYTPPPVIPKIRAMQE